jgi:large subunit ribosomal protein L32
VLRAFNFHPFAMASLLASRVPRLAPLGFIQSLALPISINVPPILADLWESVLRAVPKKKTSHMKKRHRQMAGKALKDVQNLNKCPSCGQIKRAHVLCPHCVRGKIRVLVLSRSVLLIKEFALWGRPSLEGFFF